MDEGEKNILSDMAMLRTHVFAGAIVDIKLDALVKSRFCPLLSFRA
jgi:hypothetical protein